jgi:hypothetical protein
MLGKRYYWGLDLISYVVAVAGELVVWKKSDIASGGSLLLLSNSVLVLPSPLQGSTVVCRIRLCLKLFCVCNTLI